MYIEKYQNCQLKQRCEEKWSDNEQFVDMMIIRRTKYFFYKNFIKLVNDHGVKKKITKIIINFWNRAIVLEEWNQRWKWEWEQNMYEGHFCAYIYIIQRIS